MSDNSKIEWTNATWSPVRGCSMVSAGCTNCYAMRNHHRWQKQFGVLTRKGPNGMVWTGEVRPHEGLLDAPLRWMQPRLIFVNSQSDTFHEDVPFEFIDWMFAVMALSPQHTFQVLTKRPERMREYMTWDGGFGRSGFIEGRARSMYRSFFRREPPMGQTLKPGPMPHVWLGVSVEDQKAADERIPVLLETPAAMRFLSCEPLLGPVDLRRIQRAERLTLDALTGAHTGESTAATFTDALDRARRGDLDLPTLPGRLPGIDWAIVGGESGYHARELDLAWVRSLVDQCADAKVACFVKQLGARPFDWNPNDRRMRRFPKFVNKKGGDPQEWPDEFRVRQFPLPQQQEIVW